MHGSVVACPAALAVTQDAGGGGARLLEAFIAAVEVEYALALACTEHIYFKDWWTTGLYGTIGAAVAQCCPEGAYVTLELADGRRLRDFLPRPTGMPGNPISDQALEDKFRDCFRYGGFSQERARRVADRLWRLETLDDLSSLLD
jgi:2-methylcitrate dehydratase PrpD